MVLSAAYGLWLQNRILFGNIKKFYVSEYRDLTRIEFFSLLPYAFLTIFLGVFPEFLFDYIYFF